MIVCVRQCYRHPMLIHAYLELTNHILRIADCRRSCCIAHPLNRLRNPRPDLTFINFCFTWVFSSIVFSIGSVRLGHLSPLLHTDNHRKIPDCIVGVRQALCEPVLPSLHPLWSGVLVSSCTYHRSSGDDRYLHVYLDYPSDSPPFSIGNVASRIFSYRFGSI